MPNIYTDVQVDIETTGTRPDRSAIIQIGAVKFNMNDRTVSPQIFNRSLSIPSWRSWDEDTREWWSRMPDVFSSIMKKAENPAIVMRDFADWSIQPGQPLRFWAKPTTFDFMFITSYLKDFNQPVPFDFREANDLNTFLRGIYHPNPIDRSDEPKMTGTAHDAIHDALFQTKLLFHHLDKVENAKSATNN